MLELIYPDQTRANVSIDALAGYEPFEVFMEFIVRGISWEFCDDLKQENIFHNQIKKADLRVRSSIFFIRGEHANAHTLH